MVLIKEGLFWRILVANGTKISKKKFLRFQSALNYMDLQDVHGMPVENYKRTCVLRFLSSALKKNKTKKYLTTFKKVKSLL